MIEIIPWSPFAAVWTLALLATCIFAMAQNRNLWPVIAIMLLNWTATRLVSAFDLSGLFEAIADLASAVSLVMISGRQLVTLPISALFCLMVSFSAAADFEIITRDTLWAWSDVLGYCQLIIISGGAVAGGRNGWVGVAFRRGCRNGDVVDTVAARVQMDRPS
jgi:hypothetical protein